MAFLNLNEDTIAAICTAIAASEGGVAIIRISGPDAKTVGESVVSTPKRNPWKSHNVMYGHVLDVSTKQPIDEVLTFFMQGPNSFTGEDVVEIHCHGGLIAVQQVLEAVLDHPKTRRALPGEFSQRAVLNGKLNLTQAESINELIAARSRKSAKLAMAGLDGGIQRKINQLREKLLDHLCEIEARVDFEDELPDIDKESLLKEILQVSIELKKLVQDYKQSSLLNTGLKIAIIGSPNVGKSSLLNKICKSDKAIVTNIPGTTRDLLENQIIIKGVPINLIDTAGIRATNDEVEKLGVAKSFKALSSADLIILVFDLVNGWTSEDEKLLSNIPAETMKLIVGNKCDLYELSNLNPDHKNLTQNKLDVIFSAHTGEGEDKLIQELLKKCGASDIQSLEYALNERQKDLAKAAANSLDKIAVAANDDLPWDFWTIDLRQAIQTLGEITGEEISESLLDRIFSRFCIGK